MSQSPSSRSSAETMATASEPTPAPTLGELALLFLRLGTTAFGGPAAHIAMMEDEVVQRKRWLSREKFLDLIAASNLIPGPNSTEMAIHIGFLAGWLGLVVAGVCFILPAVIIVTGFAWAYVEYQSLPQLAGVLYGVKPVIIAVVVQALWKLGRDSLKSASLAVVAAGVIGASLFWKVNELVLLFGAGGAMLALHVATMPRKPETPSACIMFGLFPLGKGLFATVPSAAFGITPLFLFFLKVGSILYGSGYVLLAFLRSDLVERFGWLTEAQLLDAVAVGQVTPGPVFTTATFIGYVLGEQFDVGGLYGALAATAGIFLPAFFFVAISGPLIPRLRRSKAAGAFLDGIIVGSLALMAVVTYDLARAAFVDWLTVVLGCVAAFLLLVFRVNSTWLVLAGGVIGGVCHSVQ